MRIAGVIKHSLVNGDGIRFVIFFQGCGHNCKGCQNPDTHDFNGGYEVDTAELIEQIRNTKHIDGVTLSGGDPMYQPEAVKEISKAVKDMGLNVWCYTGFRAEEIPKDELEYIDVLVDGEYIEMLNDGKPYRGSSNQRIIRL